MDRVPKRYKALFIGVCAMAAGDCSLFDLEKATSASQD
jgi:hypothetical protein